MMLITIASSLYRPMHSEFYQEGLAKANEKDYAGAIAAFNQALEHQPELAAAYYHRGLAHFNLGEFQAAIQDQTEALRLEADHAGSRFARGLAYLAVTHLDAAIADAKRVILLKPDSAAAYNLIGTARQRQKATEKAISSYKKAVEIYLDQREITNCRRCLGHIRELQATRPQPMPASAQAAPPLRPLINPHGFLKQALQKAQQRNYRGAMEDLDWALQIDPQDAWAYASRGKVRADLGDFRGAIDDSQQAATLFVSQSNQEMAQQMREAVQTLQGSLKQAAQQAKAYQAHVRKQATLQAAAAGRPSRAVQRKLFRLVGDDRKIAVGLVQRLKLKHPGKPEDWYWEKAIYDLSRDR
ncbi:MAG: tetratricopeptide repeat protein [Leptolyngbya sp. SIO1E4]|nr:tetratricopeptide repeat protein [Leptolyngbya sp. SIO1E4]